MLIVGAGPAGLGGGGGARQARLRGGAGRGRRRPRRPGRAGGAAARAGGLDPGRRLPPRAAAAAAQRRDAPTTARSAPTRCSATASTTSPSPPAPAGGATAVGRWHTAPAAARATCRVLTPDDLIAGARPDGERVVLFDDDHYYLGGVLAELLAREGRRVTLVTPAARVSELDGLHDGAAPHPGPADRAGRADRGHATPLTSAGAGVAVASCVYSGRERELGCDALVLVTARDPVDTLADGIVSWPAAGPSPASPACARSATPGARARSRLPSGTAAASPRSSTSRIRRCGARSWGWRRPRPRPSWAWSSSPRWRSRRARSGTAPGHRRSWPAFRRCRRG